MEGRTPVPEAEQLEKLAAHGATMVIFLSIGWWTKSGRPFSRAAATAPIPLPLWSIRHLARAEGGALHRLHTGRGDPQKRHHQDRLIVVGDFLGENYERSKLYDPAFTTEFRQGTEAGQ